MKNDALIECVPNFSEGRDTSVLSAIRESILSTGDCELWDYSSDTDHNRSVFTLAGTPDALEAAVLRFTAAAAELINMETHTGVHPCIGAADVIPFIPLRNVSMEDCIRLSEKVGQRIASELDLPVYLYAQHPPTADWRIFAGAATQSSRKRSLRFPSAHRIMDRKRSPPLAGFPSVREIS